MGVGAGAVFVLILFLVLVHPCAPRLAYACPYPYTIVILLLLRGLVLRLIFVCSYISSLGHACTYTSLLNYNYSCTYPDANPWSYPYT